MYVIMGGTGHVGSAVAQALLDRAEPVTVVTHNAEHGEPWRSKGAEVAEADIEDVASLRAAFCLGRRAFLLNPPADTTADTDTIEKRTIANIVAALEGSGLEKVVAESTGGAQPGELIGDLGTLWELEEGLLHQTIPSAINRAAYYMSNWIPLFDVARQTGTLPSMYRADYAFPMVAPDDLGLAAANRLLSDVGDAGVEYVVGPRPYSSDDVARIFSAILGREITVASTARRQWEEAYRKLGFSNAAAQSYAGMIAASLDGGFDVPDRALRGSTTLETYLHRALA